MLYIITIEVYIYCITVYRALNKAKYYIVLIRKYEKTIIQSSTESVVYMNNQIRIFFIFT